MGETVKPPIPWGGIDNACKYVLQVMMPMPADQFPGVEGASGASATTRQLTIWASVNVGANRLDLPRLGPYVSCTSSGGSTGCSERPIRRLLVGVVPEVTWRLNGFCS